MFDLDDLPFPLIVAVIVLFLILLLGSVVGSGAGRGDPCDWSAILEETAKNLPSEVADEISNAEVELWKDALMSVALDPPEIPDWAILDDEDRVAAVVAFVAERVAEERGEAYSEAVREAVEDSLKDAVRSCLDSLGR